MGSQFFTGVGFLDNITRPGTSGAAPLVRGAISYFFSPRVSVGVELERVFSETNGLPLGRDNKFELNTASLVGRFYTPV